MARLSRKQGVRVSFLLAQMTLTDDQRQRETILGDLLEALHIDADQAQQSRQSAISHIRHGANRRRKSERQAKPAADPIDGMSHEDLRGYIDELYAKRDALLAQRRIDAMNPDELRRHIDAMSDDERVAYRDHLIASIAGKIEPAPVVNDAPQYTVTEKQRRRLAAFDDMSDADQVDALKQMWGASCA